MNEETKAERTLQLAKSFRDLIEPLIKTDDKKGAWIDREEAIEYVEMYDTIRKQVERLDGTTIQENEGLAAFYLNDFGLTHGADYLKWGMKPGRKRGAKMQEALADGAENIRRGRFQSGHIPGPYEKV